MHCSLACRLTVCACIWCYFLETVCFVVRGRFLWDVSLNHFQKLSTANKRTGGSWIVGYSSGERLADSTEYVPLVLHSRASRMYSAAQQDLQFTCSVRRLTFKHRQWTWPWNDAESNMYLSFLRSNLRTLTTEFLHSLDDYIKPTNPVICGNNKILRID